VRVPAFCNNCGAVFPSGIELEDAVAPVPVDTSVGPCPVCRQSGSVADGVLPFVGGAIEVLSTPQRTELELAQLATILTEACGNWTSPDEVVARINEELPELSSVATLLPVTRDGFYPRLALIVSSISLLLQAKQRGDDAEIVTVDRTIEHIFSSTMKLAGSAEKARKRRSVRRNAPCPCGSGKKYKQCCGRLTDLAP
jgi:SEC-C motif